MLFISTMVISVVTATLTVFTLYSTGASPFQSVTVPSTGSVTTIGVGVYWDSDYSNEVSSIDWGAVEAGSSKNVTVYIRNEGNTAATLNMTTENRNPVIAESYITFTWDYNEQIVDENSVIKAIFTLSVSPDTIGVTSFSFDIVVGASQVV